MRVEREDLDAGRIDFADVTTGKRSRSLATALWGRARSRFRSGQCCTRGWEGDREQDGTARVCQLNARPLRAVGEWLRDYEAFWGESLRSLKRYVEEDGR